MTGVRIVAASAASVRTRISRSKFRFIDAIPPAQMRVSGDNGQGGCRVPSGQSLEANEREMPHWRHRPALDQAHAAVARGPIGKPLETESRPPAKQLRQRREAYLEDATRACLGADVIDQDDLAARLD